MSSKKEKGIMEKGIMEKEFLPSRTNEHSRYSFYISFGKTLKKLKKYLTDPDAPRIIVAE